MSLVPVLTFVSLVLVVSFLHKQRVVYDGKSDLCLQRVVQASPTKGKRGPVSSHRQRKEGRKERKRAKLSRAKLSRAKLNRAPAVCRGTLILCSTWAIFFDYRASWANCERLLSVTIASCISLSTNAASTALSLFIGDNYRVTNINVRHWCTEYRRQATDNRQQRTKETRGKPRGAGTKERAHCKDSDACSQVHDAGSRTWSRTKKARIRHEVSTMVNEGEHARMQSLRLVLRLTDWIWICRVSQLPRWWHSFGEEHGSLSKTCFVQSRLSICREACDAVES